jgi:hydrogenase 3 maturation protease
MSNPKDNDSAGAGPAPADETRPRVAVLGIGNELNGDDGVGVLVARHLKMLLAGQPELARRVIVYEAGPAPESFSGPLRRFAPDLVLLVDAAYLDKEPGDVEWIDWQNTEGFSASTHGLPPTLFAKFLMAELGCRVGLIGIQPMHLDFDRPMSEAVTAAAMRVAVALVESGFDKF